MQECVGEREKRMVVFESASERVREKNKEEERGMRKQCQNLNGCLSANKNN